MWGQEMHVLFKVYDTLPLYRGTMMFYLPFLGMLSIIWLFSTATILPLLSELHTLLPKLYLCWAFSCTFACGLDSLFLHQNFLFPLVSLFLCFHCVWVSFLQCSCPPGSLNSCQRFTLWSSSKASALFSPYLVYQHCQGTFYYAGNKKCL